jgi:hypothetical protein
VLRISKIDTDHERRLVLEGKLIHPWIAELRKAWLDAAATLDSRRLVIDLKNVTVISPEGETALFDLMRNGARFFCNGVLTKHVLRRLARRYANGAGRHE